MASSASLNNRKDLSSEPHMQNTEDSCKVHTDTIVIIPAFNEGKTIVQVIDAIKHLHPDIDVLVINDGSGDETARLAEKAGAVVLSHPVNMGYGVSLQTGYKYAAWKNYRYLIQMDGDGQHDPEGISILLENIKNREADIVLGSRFMGAGTYKPSVFRGIGIRLFRFFLQVLSGLKIQDVTTGFQAMNRRVLDLFITDIFPCDYPDADVILLLSELNFRIREVPVTMHQDMSGKSLHNNPLNVLYYIFKMSLSMLLTKMRKHSIDKGGG
jgi:glycosyltransferase involved in cell wall biosynthesis